MEYVPFDSSMMGRGILIVHFVDTSDNEWTLMTSHLESMKGRSKFSGLGLFRISGYRKPRMQQFNEILKYAKQYSNRKVVFGGDFNMRDTELKDIDDSAYFKQNITDSWIKAGNDTNKYTWDLGKSNKLFSGINIHLVINDNKILDLPFQPRCRFDRVYFNSNVNCHSFTLEGQEKIKKDEITGNNVDKFISDHFALAVDVQ